MSSKNKKSERKVSINEEDNRKYIQENDEDYIKYINNSSNSNNSNNSNSICSNCSKEPAQYMNYPCGCNIYCKGCAMKIATGGKCKKCNSIFSSMKSLIPNNS